MHIFFFFSPWLLVIWAMPHEHFKTPCQWLLEPRLGLMICRKTHWAQHTVEGTAVIYDNERLLGKSAKGKVHGARSRGKQAQSSKSPVPVELHRMYFFIPSAVIITCVRYHLPGKLITDSMAKVYTGASSEAPSACYLLKCQAPRRKAGAQHKIYCLYNIAGAQ